MALLERQENLTHPHYKIFIYGENGSGKTQLAATLPGKLAFINYDANVEVLLKMPGVQERTTVFKGPTEWRDIQQLFKSSELDEFDSVILDNSTGLSRVLLSGSLKIPMKGEGTRPSPEIPILRDYGLAAERLRYVVSDLVERVTKQNVVCISHVKLDKDEDSGGLVGGPSLPGQVPAFVLSKFLEVIFLKMEPDGIPKAYFKQHIYWPATSRMLISREAVKNPNLTALYFRPQPQL